MSALIDWVGAYCISMTLLVSAVIPSTLRKHLLCLAGSIAAGVLFPSLQPHFMVVLALLLPLVYHADERDRLRLLLKCLTAIFILWALILCYASAITLLLSESHMSRAYNLWIGALLATSAVALRTHPAPLRRFVQMSRKAMPYAIAMELLVICFFTFALPLLGVSDLRKYCIINLSVMALILAVVLLYGYLLRLERQIRDTANSQRMQQEMTRRTREQYRAMIGLKHYYSDMFQSLSQYIRDNDMPQLKGFFEAHIGRVHNEHLESDIRLIGNDLIRSLVDSYVSGLQAMPNEPAVEFSINETVVIPESLASPLFEIMSIYLANLSGAIARQQAPRCVIDVTQSESGCCVTIANSVTKRVNISRMYRDWDDSRQHGYGLYRAAELARIHEDISLHTSCTNELFTQKIWIRRQRDV